jgi:cell division protein FtsN
MLSARHPGPPRHEFRVGTRELGIFGGAFLLIWALTFVFGMLVGRELGRPGGDGRAAVAVPGPSERTASGANAPPAKRPEPAPSEDRLTFYKTLTAPTLDVPATPPPRIEERIVPREAPARPAPRTGRAAAALPPAPAAPAEAAAAEAPASPPAPAPSPPAGRLWTVQVSSFRSRALAEELRTHLAAKGFDAYLVRVATDEGRVWHRVRVGAYPTRTEAERVASELKAERNVNPVVTSRPR